MYPERKISFDEKNAYTNDRQGKKRRKEKKAK